MTNAKTATDTIAALAELYPQAFSVYAAKRRPLKNGIHHDLLATGAITAKECAAALRFYTGNGLYLKACKAGAARIDLEGNTIGYVTTKEANHAQERLSRQIARWKCQQEALAKAKLETERRERNKGRIGLRDLRAMAKARREASRAA